MKEQFQVRVLGGEDVASMRHALHVRQGLRRAIALYTRLGVREEVPHFDIAPAPAPR